jgi:hypothetical protein
MWPKGGQIPFRVTATSANVVVMSSSDDVAARAQWDRQRIWSRAADRAKKRMRQARLRALTLATTGAVLGTLSAELSDRHARLGRVCAVLAAVALALAPVLGGTVGRTIVRDWTRMRAVSELLKTEIYMFLARVAPYRGDDRVRRLLDEGDRIVAEADDLTSYTVAASPGQRDLPDVRDVPSYLELRVGGQIERYYRPRADHIHRTVRRLGFVQLTLAAAGAVLAAVSGVMPGARLGAWVGVTTTIGAAVAAHVAAERYEYQEVEFTRTAGQLTALRTRYLAGPRDQAADDELVAAAERIISTQNEGWMARQTSADPDPSR